MNKDEAEKCLSISKQKYRSGDSTGSLKFALKSVKLLDTKEAADWVKFLNSNPSAASNSADTKPGMRKPRSRPSSTSNHDANEAPSRPFTPEQAQGIKKILECKKKGDLYAILGLEKGCSDNDIKKAYRKRALLYHPDKCGAPGTDDAFKAIAHAWTILGDEEKRSNYNRFGIDGGSSRGVGANPFAHNGFGGRHHQFEGEISPEDLLRMFMGGGGGFGGVFNTGPGFRNRAQFHQRRQRNAGNAEDDNSTATLMQLLPVLLLFLISILSFFTTQDDPFSFHMTHEYRQAKHTPNHNVEYFVNPHTFERRFATYRQKSDLAKMVDSEYLKQLRIKCNQERQNQQFYIQQAQGWFSVDKAKLEKAKNMHMPYCNQVAKWFR